MAGGYGDAFYLQSIKNIRKNKTVACIENSFQQEEKSSDIDAGVDQWESVTAEYRMIGKKQPPRDAYGVAKTLRYTQPAPENNLQVIKVCHDDEYIYLLIRTEHPIKPYDGNSNWMNLLLGIGQPSLKGWEVYEFLISRDDNEPQLQIRSEK